MPDVWNNIFIDMPNKLKPSLHPANKQLLSPEDMLPLFPSTLIEQEMSLEK